MRRGLPVALPVAARDSRSGRPNGRGRTARLGRLAFRTDGRSRSRPPPAAPTSSAAADAPARSRERRFSPASASARQLPLGLPAESRSSRPRRRREQAALVRPPLIVGRLGQQLLGTSPTPTVTLRTGVTRRTPARPPVPHPPVCRKLAEILRLSTPSASLRPVCVSLGERGGDCGRGHGEARKNTTSSGSASWCSTGGTPNASESSFEPVEVAGRHPAKVAVVGSAYEDGCDVVVVVETGPWAAARSRWRSGIEERLSLSRRGLVGRRTAVRPRPSVEQAFVRDPHVHRGSVRARNRGRLARVSPSLAAQRVSGAPGLHRPTARSPY